VDSAKPKFEKLMKDAETRITSNTNPITAIDFMLVPLTSKWLYIIELL
jgi:hypothetical protein